MGQRRKVHLKWDSVPFLLVHLACIAVFWVPFSAGLLALFAGLTLLKMFGITGGYHRYFAHTRLPNRASTSGRISFS